MATTDVNGYTTSQITNDLMNQYQSSTKQRTPTKELGKDDFLQLLTTQLKYQDPTQPLDNKEFISQQANFSTLEQMTNLNKSFTSFLENQSLFSKMNAVNFIGKNVTTTVAANEEGTEFVSGKVSGVKFVDNEYVFKVGSSDVKLSEIVGIDGN